MFKNIIYWGMIRMIREVNDIQDIEDYIRKYDKVLVVEDANKYILNENVLKERSSFSNRILIICRFADRFNSEQIDLLINQSVYEQICKLYFLYEFSNKIQFVSQLSQYASMLNYLSTGLLTEDEFLEALLY